MIRIEISDVDVDRAFARLSAKLADLTPVMREIGELLVDSTQRRMLEGQTPEGAPFAPRSPTTLDVYTRRNVSYGPVPLFMTGEMRQQLAAQHGPDWVEIGSNAIQAAVMQFGAAKGSLGPRSPWGNIPARPFLGLSGADRTGIVELVEEWLSGASETD